MQKTMKWILLFVSGFLVLVLFFFFWLYSFSSRNLRENIERATQKQMDHAAYLLETDIKEAELNALSISSDRRIRFVKGEALTNDANPDYVEKNSAARSLLVDQVQTNESLESITVYWPESQALISSYDTIFEQIDFYEEIPRNGWFVNNERMFYTTSYPYVYMNTVTTSQPDYVVVAEMSRYHLEEVRGMISNTENSRNLLLFPDFTSISTLSQKDQKALEAINAAGGINSRTGKGQFELAGKDYLYFVAEDKKSGIKLASYLPVSDVLLPVQRVAMITGAGIIIIILAALLIVLLFYKNISQQLAVLVAKFKQVENGDFETQIERLPQNEFGYVFEQFNQMVVGSRSLLDSLVREQKSRDQAEIKQLQFQISPHFLYNSLGYLVAVSHDPDAVTNMSAHLADYYQYSTRSNQETTLGKELDFAENYLEIMMIRKDLEYLINADDTLREIPILPILIQPLIENAIQHGIEGKAGAHWICVTAEETEEGIRIAVEDDGYGMSPVAIKQLLDNLAQSVRPDELSVGLWNVNQRLVNRYGRDARLRFETNELAGLTVWFVIEKPIVVKES